MRTTFMLIGTAGGIAMGCLAIGYTLGALIFTSITLGGILGGCICALHDIATAIRDGLGPEGWEDAEGFHYGRKPDAKEEKPQ